MRRLLLVLLVAACASSEGTAPPTMEQPGKIVGEAELDVASMAEGEGPQPALLLELRSPGAVPARLGSELGAGHGWLRLEGPRGLSFAGRDLLAGEGPFRAAAASLLFVQPQGGAQGAEPALFRLTGVAVPEALAVRIERIAAPKEDPSEPAQEGNANQRVLLGRGLDNLLTCVGSTEVDAHHWIGVVDAEGRPAVWRDALAAARASRRLAPLAPYRVLVRRRHPGAAEPEHFRVRLDDVVVAAQMRLVARKEAFDWVWEGIWAARLVPPPEGATAGPWPPGAPPLTVRYKEYVPPSGGASGSFWRTLLTPLTLGADFGMAFLEGDEPLLDSVGERQRARN